MAPAEAKVMNLYALRVQARRMRAAAEQAAECSRLEAEAAVVGPMPDITQPGALAEAYDRYVVWRHAETSEPIRGISELQRKFLETSSCFRWRNGKRLPGSSIWLKSRKVKATSLICGCLGLVMAHTPGFRCGTVVHELTGDVGRDRFDQMLGMLLELPESWLGGEPRPRGGESITLPNGSKWVLFTAGSDKATASKRARGGTLHAVHLTEPGEYSNAAEVWSGLKGAMPERSGWIIAECTPPESHDHWFAQEWDATRRGEGSFLDGYFTPWQSDPERRIDEDDPRYATAMSPELAAIAGEQELAREDQLELTTGQRAWRRYHYFKGTKATRLKNRKEYPEDEHTCFISDQLLDSYLNKSCLDMVDAMVRTPLIEHQIARGFVCRAWAIRADYCIVGIDTATYRGEDESALYAIDPWTRDVLAEVTGHAIPEWIHVGLLWILDTLQCRGRHQHTITPERNNDQKIGYIDRVLTPREQQDGLHLYRRPVIDPITRQQRVSDKVGHHVSETNRSAYIDAVAYWSEGVQDPEHPELYGPQCQIPSAVLAHQLRALVMWPDGKVRAKQSEHDDSVLAWAGALRLAEDVKIIRPSSTPVPPTPHRPPIVVDGIRSRGRRMPS